MSKIVWDEDGKRSYETGTDRGVLYVQETDATTHITTYGAGVGWDGLTGVSENPTGATATAKYANNHVYGNLTSQEQFAFTITAFTYPDEWEQCDGSASPTGAPGVYVTAQRRKTFGMTYRTYIGNDTEGTDYGYTLHLVYGATASVSKRDNVSVNDTPDMLALSWDATTIAIPIEGFTQSAHIKIKSTEATPEALAALETILYGADAVTGTTPSEAVDPRLPLPAEVFTLMGATAG